MNVRVRSAVLVLLVSAAAAVEPRLQLDVGWDPWDSLDGWCNWKGHSLDVSLGHTWRFDWFEVGVAGAYARHWFSARDSSVSFNTVGLTLLSGVKRGPLIFPLRVGYDRLWGFSVVPGISRVAGWSPRFSVGVALPFPRRPSRGRVGPYLAGGCHLGLTDNFALTPGLSLSWQTTPLPPPDFVDPLSPAPSGGHRNLRAVGVVLAVENYERMEDAVYARADARRVREYFVTTLGIPDGQVISDSNLATVDLALLFSDDGPRKSRLRRLAERHLPESVDVFVYFSGHGAPPRRGSSDSCGSLLGRDASLETDGFPLQSLLNYLASLPIRTAIVFIDACFSGMADGKPLVKGARITNDRGAAAPTPDTTRIALLAASEPTQVSIWYPEKRHGLFTYFLLDGLRGAADRDSNRAVTLGELHCYVRDSVEDHAYLGRISQTPLLRGDAGDTIVRLSPKK